MVERAVLVRVARADNALISSAIDTNPTRYTPAIIQSCSAIIVPLQISNCVR